jgi:hypothetical protein
LFYINEEFLFINHQIEIMDELSDEDLNNPLLSGIEIGDFAPDFSMKNVCSDISEMITLSEEIKRYRGILLIFFRGAW